MPAALARIQRCIITEPASPGICFSDGFKTRSLVKRQILGCLVSLAALILIRISNRWEAGGAHCKLIEFTRWAWVSAISLLVWPPLCCAALPVNYILARQEAAAASSGDRTCPPPSYRVADVLKLWHIKVTLDIGGCEGNRGGWN